MGKPVTRQYQIDLSPVAGNVADVFLRFARSPDDFLPVRYASFGGSAFDEGSNVQVAIGGPWNGPVEVLRDRENVVRLITRQGHLEAGWIEFSFEDDGESAYFRVESTATAGDRAYLFVHNVARVGRWVQADMWSTLCESIAENCGLDEVPIVEVSTIEHDEGS